MKHSSVDNIANLDKIKNQDHQTINQISNLQNIIKNMKEKIND